MHYIRFLKPPRLSSTHPNSISAKITITTDLGESFLPIDVPLLVDLEDESGRVLNGSKTEALWMGSRGMRALEVVLALHVRSGNVRMFFRPKEERYAVDGFESLLEYKHGSNDDSEEDGENGGIVAVRSMHIDVTGKNSTQARLAERVFTSGSGTSAKNLRIWEETGESIARHIWYAASSQLPVSGQVRPSIIPC